MTKKDFAAKLAEGVRRARQSPAASAADAAPVAPEPLPAKATWAARPADLSPSPTLDRPWDNLHPQRIWPD